MKRRSLTMAVLALALMLGALGLVRLSTNDASAQTSQTATPAVVTTTTSPSPLASPSPIVQTVTKEKSNRGLWGLLGLAGLAGLSGLLRRPQPVVVPDATERTYVEPRTTTRTTIDRDVDPTIDRRS